MEEKWRKRVSSQLELREQILSELKKIILDTLNGLDVKVYLFGSWARNEEKQSSDIDIAVEFNTHQFPSSKWLELHERIEESTIPYHVDVVNLENANSTLVKNVKKEGVTWKDFKND
jgi:predicted nucleotidyltransferase